QLTDQVFRLALSYTPSF
ncbi:hypothetical protein ACMD2_13231, partial [Ananas comosus]